MESWRAGSRRLTPTHPADLPKPDFYIAAALYPELTFSPRLAVAPYGSLCSRFRARTFVRAHGRHAIVDSARSASTGLLCGRLLVALVESVLRPGGWENMCRLMCHCVRHISLDNKHGRSVKAIHSSRSRWRDGTESVPAHRKSRRQEELDWERESPKVLREVSEVRHDAVSSPQV